MNEKTIEKSLNKRFNTMQKYIYDEIFVKSDNLDIALKECLKKCIKYIYLSKYIKNGLRIAI